MKFYTFKSLVNLVAKLMVLMMLGMLALNVVIVVCCFVNHTIKSGNEKALLDPPGVVVSVNDKDMHVYASGDIANETIVLLHNVADADAAISMKPFIDELSDTYRVVLVDRPGNGYSQNTKAPRDSDTMLAEIRQALDEAGEAKEGYTIMAFGSSGLIAWDWALTYPSEVHEVIGVNMSYPEQYRDYVGNFYDGFTKKLMVLYTNVGGVRMAKGLYPDNAYGLYNENEMSKINAMVSNYFYTNMMYKEEMAMPQSAMAMLDKNISSDITLNMIWSNPLLEPYFSSDEKTKTDVEELLEKYPDFDFVGMYNQTEINYFEGIENASSVEMSGPYDLYNFDPAALASQVDTFLSE